MSEVLRAILIVISIGTCIFISRKLKKAQVDAHDTIFWFLTAGVFILLSLFPQIADECARFMKIYSSENFVFLVIIFLLLMKIFFMNIKMSQLEHKIMELVEELAVKEKLRDELEEDKNTIEIKTDERGKF